MVAQIIYIYILNFYDHIETSSHLELRFKLYFKKIIFFYIF